MSLLPENTYLGRLKIIEVYEATDEPCLFACRNASGHIFLSVLIDETEELKHCERGKYVERYRQGTNLVKIDLDLADMFPTERSVNDALRQFLASQSISA
jgi:hypothetical protein